jgi:hypothetical protein
MLCPLADDRGVSSFIIGPGGRLRVPGPVLWSCQGPCFDRGGLRRVGVGDGVALGSVAVFAAGLSDGW